MAGDPMPQAWERAEGEDPDDDTRIIVITSETVLKRRLSTACKPTNSNMN